MDIVTILKAIGILLCCALFLILLFDGGASGDKLSKQITKKNDQK